MFSRNFIVSFNLHDLWEKKLTKRENPVCKMTMFASPKLPQLFLMTEAWWM